MDSLANLSVLSALYKYNTQPTEKFSNAMDGLTTYGIIIIVVFAILFAILVPIASYRIMGNSALHAVLAFVFGFIYVLCVWLWAGLFTKRKLKL
jgi:hypothetical protein